MSPSSAEDFPLQLMEHSSDAIFVADGEGRMRAVNRAACEMFGATREKLLGGRFGELLDPPGFGPGELLGAGRVERRLRRLDGSSLVCEVHARATAPGELLMVLRDVTERRRRDGHQALLAGIAHDFARLSSEHDITRAIGCRLAEHLGITTCSVADFADGIAHVRSAYNRDAAPHPPDMRLRVADYLNAELQQLALAGETIVLHDIRRDPRADAERYEALGVRAGVIVPLLHGSAWVHSFAVGLPVARHWHDDEVELLEEVARRYFPRIERARAEEALRVANAQLRDADRKKDEFIAVLSHELRNPLTAITSALFVLESSAGRPDGAGRARDIIKRQVAHLSSLVNDLLDVNRITRDKVELHREPLDLSEAALRAAEDHRFSFESAGIQLDVTPAPQPVGVLADRTRVAQMIGNLLHNAAKFTSRGGHTRVSVFVDGGSAAVRVSDDGIGISPELLDRLFEPFAQAEQALDRDKGGLGLGLVLVKRLAQLHGGAVTAASPGPGRGSEFTLTLPLASAAFDVTKAPAAPRRVARRVLIIEDNADAAESLRDALEIDGHEVALAGTGAEGVETARAFEPEIVLCDLGLPGMDGYAVARALRDDAVTSGTYLVALTGYARADDVRRSKEAGFDAHLAKPVDLDVLSRTITDLA